MDVMAVATMLDSYGTIVDVDKSIYSCCSVVIFELLFPFIHSTMMLSCKNF
jgi:hypothetical protein